MVPVKFSKGKITVLAVGFSFIFFLFSCSEEQEDPVSPIPDITVESFEFVKEDEPDISNDTFILKLKFKDGDMNLGLFAAEIDSPYHEGNFFYRENNTFKKTSNINHPGLIQYGDYDSLPPFNCKDYYINSVENNDFTVDEDTLYFEPNDAHYNILITFYIKKGEEFVESEKFNNYQLVYGGCSSGYWGRFPPIDLIVDPPKDHPFEVSFTDQFEGILTYNIRHPVFYLAFKGETVKLTAQILDRDLNRSNIVETQEIKIE